MSESSKDGIGPCLVKNGIELDKLQGLLLKTFSVCPGQLLSHGTHIISLNSLYCAKWHKSGLKDIHTCIRHMLISVFLLGLTSSTNKNIANVWFCRESFAQYCECVIGQLLIHTYGFKMVCGCLTVALLDSTSALCVSAKYNCACRKQVSREVAIVQS